MNIRFVTDAEIKKWDALLAKNPDGGNVFQSIEVAKTKRANGWTPRYLMIGELSVTILEKSVFAHGKFWYLPKGPGVTSTDELITLLPDLTTFAVSRGVFAIKLEPEIIESDGSHRALEAANLIRTKAVQPNSSTVIVDLTPDLDDIIMGFNQKGRNALRRAERDGVKTYPAEITEETMKIMFGLLSETAAGRFDASLRSYEYYRAFWLSFAQSGHGSLFFAEYEGRIVAAAYCMYLGEKGLYKDGASLREKVTYGASHLLQWEAIKWMKDHGVTSYDLCGAPHSSEIHNSENHFYGIGKFKTQFNKHITDYIGCYDLVVNQRAYTRWQKFGQRLAISLSWRLKHQQWF